jgi:hypothetical protein
MIDKTTVDKQILRALALGQLHFHCDVQEDQ